MNLMESSNKYIITFIIIMTVVAAVSLAGMREITLSASTKNEEIFSKRSVLLTVNDYLGKGLNVNDLSDDEVLKMFNEQVEQVVLNINGEVVPNLLAEKIDLSVEKKKAEADRLLPLFVREQYVMSFLTMKKLSISRKITLFLYSIVVIHNGIGMVCIVIVDEKVSLASR